MSSPISPDPAAGVFETLLVHDGVPVELDRHLERLAGSVGELYGARLPELTRALVVEEAAGLPLGRLRLTVVPRAGTDPAAEVATAAVEPQAVFPGWARAIGLRTFAAPGGLGPHKWADRDALARMEAEAGEGCLPLLLDSGEVVLEGSRANLFALEDETVITPPADGRILPGVARACAIEAARSLGLEVREQELALERLQAAPEAFLTGSVRGIEPVSSVEGARYEGEGKATRAIAEAMRRRWLSPVAAEAR